MNFHSFCLSAVKFDGAIVGCVRNNNEFPCFLHCFFMVELGGVQRLAWNQNFSSSGCWVALFNFWCPEVRLEFFRCPEVRVAFKLLGVQRFG